MRQRYSRQRELILRCVETCAEHPSAEMVYQRLKPSVPTLSRGTVYRNLSLLVQQGLLKRIPLSVDRYDSRTDPHPHFQCRNCAAVFDLDLPYDGKLDQEAAQKSGMTVMEHELIFSGLCKECVLRERGGEGDSRGKDTAGSL